MDAEAFIRWALDDARNVEERYTVELLVEDALRIWNVRHKTGYHEPWEKKRARNRQRHLNPAYDPRYSPEALSRAVEVLAEQKSWTPHVSSYDSRPIRDLGALRFLPRLEEVKLDGEIADLSPVADLPRLRVLHFGSTECTDFRPLARCRALRDLTISLGFPGAYWPEIAGLEKLEELETFALSGNLLLFPPGVVWPRVRVGTLSCGPLAARSVRDLPQFPLCEFLTLGGVERLDGIEAFPRLRNLTLQGPVRDFSPLVALTELTWLAYSHGQPRDVAPLARLPRLRYASFESKHNYGLDTSPLRNFSPLSASPTLREFRVKGCPPLDMEVAAINAALPPWDPLFLAETPREVPATLRMIVSRALPQRHSPHREPGEPELVDTGLRACEGTWVGGFVGRLITERIGHADWGEASASGAYHSFFVTIESYETVERLPDILEAMRQALARLRADYEADFMISLRVPPPKPTPAQAKLLQKFQDEQEEAEWERDRTERAEHLERLHLYELSKQEGDPIDPQEFAPPEPTPLPPAPWEREESEEDDEEGGDAAGGIAVKKKKPEPPPRLYVDDEHPLASNYRLLGHLNLREVWFYPHHRALAVHLMRREPDWVVPEEEPAAG